jgi:hypothetical protein
MPAALRRLAGLLDGCPIEIPDDRQHRFWTRQELLLPAFLNADNKDYVKLFALIFK